MVTLCTYCGTAVNDSPFCESCGARATPANAARGPAAESRAPLPGVAPTVAITLLFGPFGLIPATDNSNRAKSEGESGSKYWWAFGLSLVAQVSAWFVVYLIATGSAAWLDTPERVTADQSAASTQQDDSRLVDGQPETITLPPDGRECATDGVGSYAAAAAGNTSTSCAFAEAVRDAYNDTGVAGTRVSVEAYSLVTKQWYTMSCRGDRPVICDGGEGAQVLIYSSNALVY